MSNQSKISDCIDHAYFTSEEDATFVVNELRKAGWLYEGATVLEPSCGSGALVKPIKDASVTLADLVDYGVGADIGDYLQSNYGTYDLVLTNPPFGKMARLAVSFFNKAVSNSDRIAFIVPQSFRKISIVDRLDANYWPVADFDLPNQLYDLPDGSQRKVRTCFQMWERREVQRAKLGAINYGELFVSLTKAQAMRVKGAYALRGQGAKAGKVLEGLDHSEASTRFLVGSKETVESLDLTKIAGFTAGIPSLGFAELAYALSLKGNDQKMFLEKGIVALLISGSGNFYK